MNIIELFEKLNLERGKFYQFSAEEIIKIEKRINVEKKLNPEIDNNVASNLVLALKNYPQVFDFLANDFVLYNFFAKSKYPRSHFKSQKIEIDSEQIKAFIDEFLSEDLVLYFDKKMTQNAFDDMEYLLQSKEYFPQEVLYKIEKKAFSKLDFSVNQLDNLAVDMSHLNYLKHKIFYDFLSHFSSPGMDECFTRFINKITAIYNKQPHWNFSSSVIISLSNYNAYSDELKELMLKNKKVANENIESKTSSSSTFSGKSIFFIIVFVLKVIWILSKCSSNQSNTIYQNNYDNGIYRNSNTINYQMPPSSAVDSVFEKETTKITAFKTYLTTPVSKIAINSDYKLGNFKTGENPFTNVYANARTLDLNSSELMFKNNSDFDVVVLENAVKKTSIGRINNFASRSYFIKSKESVAIRIDSEEEKVFNFYIGNALASFGKDADFKIFDAMNEYRFTKIPESASFIMDHDFKFGNDVTIDQNGEEFSIKSRGMLDKKRYASSLNGEFKVTIAK